MNCEELQQVFNSLGTGVVLDLRGLTIIITQRLEIKNKSDFTILGSGAKFIASPSLEVKGGNQLLLVQGCNNFKIQDITVNGNRSQRIPKEVAAHNVDLKDCHNFSLINIVSINAVVDGFYFGAIDNTNINTYCSEFKVLNCSTDNCYRQGASIINAHNFIIDGGIYKNTNGTAPSAGIDIESNTGATISNKNGIIKNCLFEGNQGVGLLISHVGGARNFNVSGCYFNNNNLGAINCATSNVKIESCYFENHINPASLGVIVFSAQESSNHIVDSNTFIDNMPPGIYTHSMTSHTRVTNNFIKNNADVGIKLSGKWGVVRNNTINISTNIGILSSSDQSIIDSNTILNSKGRGIFSSGKYTVITGNRIKDISDVVGAYIQVSGEYSVIKSNILSSEISTAVVPIRTDVLNINVQDNLVSGLTLTNNIKV